VLAARCGAIRIKNALDAKDLVRWS
jgi:hypothetical protein